MKQKTISNLREAHSVSDLMKMMLWVFPQWLVISARTTHNARTGTLVPNKSVALIASACQVSLHWVLSACECSRFVVHWCNSSALTVCVFLFNVTNNTVLVLLVSSLLIPLSILLYLLRCSRPVRLNVRLFCGYIGLFCGYIGLCCGYIGLLWAHGTTHNARTGTLVPNRWVALSAECALLRVHWVLSAFECSRFTVHWVLSALQTAHWAFKCQMQQSIVCGPDFCPLTESTVSLLLWSSEYWSALPRV